MRRDIIRLVRRLLRGERRRHQRRRGIGPVLLSVVVILATVVINSLNREEADAPLPAKGSELACVVRNVYDGDTLTASCDQGKLKVRLFGIDAPEMGQQPWGKQARDLLRRLVPRGDVRLEVRDIDGYGRVVARVLDGDQDLGLELVREGVAVVYERYNKSRIYFAVQAQARNEGRGVWSEPGAQQQPWEWRKVNPRS